eukprot:sb/3477878/
MAFQDASVFSPHIIYPDHGRESARKIYVFCLSLPYRSNNLYLSLSFFLAFYNIIITEIQLRLTNNDGRSHKDMKQITNTSSPISISFSRMKVFLPFPVKHTHSLL